MRSSRTLSSFSSPRFAVALLSGCAVCLYFCLVIHVSYDISADTESFRRACGTFQVSDLLIMEMRRRSAAVAVLRCASVAPGTAVAAACPGPRRRRGGPAVWAAPVVRAVTILIASSGPSSLSPLALFASRRLVHSPIPSFPLPERPPTRASTRQPAPPHPHPPDRRCAGPARLYPARRQTAFRPSRPPARAARLLSRRPGCPPSAPARPQRRDMSAVASDGCMTPVR